MKTYDELLALIQQRGVHPVFGGAGESDWGIEQNAAELAEFLVVCQQLGVSSVLEIGTGYKAGLARFLHDDLGWTVVSVDIHDYGHPFGGIQFITAGHDVVGQFDLVLIDGDHNYEGVKHDHEHYAALAAKVIAFHDIAGLRDCEGVAQYWREISDNIGLLNGTDELLPGYHEIIAASEQRGGIGYVVLAEVEAPEGRTFVGSSEARIANDYGAPEMSVHSEVPKLELPPAKSKPQASQKPAPRKGATDKTYSVTLDNRPSTWRELPDGELPKPPAKRKPKASQK